MSIYVMQWETGHHVAKPEPVGVRLRLTRGCLGEESGMLT